MQRLSKQRSRMHFERAAVPGAPSLQLRCARCHERITHPYALTQIGYWTLRSKGSKHWVSNSRRLRRHGDLWEMTEMEKHSLHGRVETKFERAPKALIERLAKHDTAK